MTENEAIEILRNNFPKTCKMVNGRYKGGFDDTECEFGKALLASISALEESQQYRAIGTVEECRETMERYRKRKPIILSEQSVKSEGKLYVAKYFKCPTCGNTSTYFGGLPNNCHNCGQSLESDIS